MSYEIVLSHPENIFCPLSLVQNQKKAQWQGKCFLVRIQQAATGCLILLHPPNFLLEIRVIIRIESNPWYPRIYETFEQEWGKKNSNFFEFWILEFCCFKKSQFFKSTNSEHFFTKISGNGPWITRKKSWIGQGCSSSYMVVRLSNKRSF